MNLIVAMFGLVIFVICVNVILFIILIFKGITINISHSLSEASDILKQWNTPPEHINCRSVLTPIKVKKRKRRKATRKKRKK